MSVINDYKEMLYLIGNDWIEENYEDYNNFDYLYDDMTMVITGNDGGTPEGYSKSMAREVIWEDEFISYCEDICTDIGELMKRGEEVIDCYARYMVCDYYLYNKFEEHFRELKEEEWAD